MVCNRVVGVGVGCPANHKPAIHANHRCRFGPSGSWQRSQTVVGTTKKFFVQCHKPLCHLTLEIGKPWNVLPYHQFHLPKDDLFTTESDTQTIRHEQEKKMKWNEMGEKLKKRMPRHVSFFVRSKMEYKKSCSITSLDFQGISKVETNARPPPNRTHLPSPKLRQLHAGCKPYKAL